MTTSLLTAESSSRSGHVSMVFPVIAVLVYVAASLVNEDEYNFRFR